MKKSTKKKKLPPLNVNNIEKVLSDVRENIRKAKPNFSITLTLGDQVFKGKGETALDALQSIPKPVKLMSKGTFFMTDGVKEFETLMYPIRLRRLFYSKLSQQIQLKTLCQWMK